MNPAIEKLYGNKVRVRACGLCWRDGKLLMVNHKGLGAGDFWAPPGGGVEFLESVEQRLAKEFVEETGLHISVNKFLFACEFLRAPLHAIELFFEVRVIDGELKKGDDPEMSIIGEVKFMSAEEITHLPQSDVHGIFRVVGSPRDLRTLTGFFRI